MTRTKWPSTPAEKQDRNKVVELVRIVGREQLRWTMADLRAGMDKMRHLRLEHPEQLARHVTALSPTKVISVGQPLRELAGVTDAASARAQHLYILTERLAAHNATPPDIPKAVRAYVALWVACRAAGAEWVDTNAVTRVCRTIDELTVDDRLPMNTRLTALERRGTPLVERERQAGTARAGARRWQRWRPLGVFPNVAGFDDWVALVQELETDRPPATRVGHVTLNDLLGELIEITLDRSTSRAWPHGHSIQLTDLRAACAENPRAAALKGLLEQRGTTLGRVLGDTTKKRIAGRARVDRRIVKVGVVDGEQTYYDMPDRTGFEARSLIVPYKQLIAAINERVVDHLKAEQQGAARLEQQGTHPVLRAIAAVRALQVHRELERLDTVATSLTAQQHLLSDQIREAIERRIAKLHALHRSIGSDGAAALATAEDAVRAVGGDFTAIMEAPRPLLLGEDYLEWVPPGHRRGRRGTQLIANAKILRRYPNPLHTLRSDRDSRRAASTGVDRADALVYLAEQVGAKTLRFLQMGAELLGATLREPSLPRLLLNATDVRLRSRALAALVLLGAPDAITEARRILHDRQAVSDMVINALYALSVMKTIDPRTWPDWHMNSADPQVRSAMYNVTEAPRRGWLVL